MSEQAKSGANPIRVLMVSPFPEQKDKVVGGVAGVAYYLCQHLKDVAGVEISVLVPDCDIEQPQSVFMSGVQVNYLPKVQSNIGERVLQTGSAKLVADFVNNGDFDLVHVQAAPEWASKIDIPVVVTLHGILEQDMLYRRGGSMLRKLMLPLVRMREQIKRRQIENLIVINPYVLDTIGRAMSGRAWHIENPIRRDFYEIERQVKRHTVLCVGVVTPRKNIANLIEATHIVRRTVPDVLLRIAGSLDDSSYVEHCRAEVARFGLEDHVEFLGSISVEQLREQLAQTQVMALSSLQETAPLSIAEAMAAGVPVVASDICGIPHMIENGVTGFLVDPLDSDEIAQGIVDAFSFDVQEVAQVCKHSTMSRFSGDVVAHRTAAVYEEILLEQRERSVAVCEA